MKKFNYLLSLLAIFLFFSCESQTNNELYVETSANQCASIVNDNSIFKITENRALEYANIVFNRNKTRSISEITVDYVIEQSNARSISADTLAYIFNRGNNEGFVIISSDNRVNPLLAFSDSGHFENDENSVVHQEFLSKIGDYIDANSENDSVSFSADFFDGCYVIQSNISGAWNQWDPWNQIVNRYHPNCPTGCVAVATAMVMTHCKESLLYHGIDFPLARMATAIDQNSNARIVGGSGGSSNSVVPLSYDSAVFYAAHLLYNIGLDVEMTYSTDGSWASSSKALRLLQNEGFTLRHSVLADYDFIDIIDYIRDGDMIYMRGSAIDTIKINPIKLDTVGHAWVVDAAMYCVDYETNETTDGYLYCRWGWGGASDGFYKGDIFPFPTVNGYYTPTKYFAIDRFY